MKNVDLILCETLGGTERVLAYCEAYNAAIDEIAIIDDYAYRIVERCLAVDEKAAHMARARECTALYSLSWEKENSHE